MNLLKCLKIKRYMDMLQFIPVLHKYMSSKFLGTHPDVRPAYFLDFFVNFYQIGVFKYTHPYLTCRLDMGTSREIKSTNNIVYSTCYL